jgi:hypothetical protein
VAAESVDLTPALLVVEHSAAVLLAVERSFASRLPAALCRVLLSPHLHSSKR